MNKIYITKSELKETIDQLIKDNTDYPKPVLKLLAAIATAIIGILVLIGLAVIIVIAVFYLLLFWIDILVGKYIIKRILKL
jgi:fatty acid desaturase